MYKEILKTSIMCLIKELRLAKWNRIHFRYVRKYLNRHRGVVLQKAKETHLHLYILIHLFKNERIWTFPTFNSFFVVVICDNPRTTNNGQLTDLYLQFLGAKRCKWSAGNLLRQLAAGNILRHCYLLINLYFNLHYKIQLIFYQLYTSKHKKLGETKSSYYDAAKSQCSGGQIPISSRTWLKTVCSSFFFPLKKDRFIFNLLCA